MLDSSIWKMDGAETKWASVWLFWYGRAQTVGGSCKRDELAPSFRCTLSPTEDIWQAQNPDAKASLEYMGTDS